MPALNDLWSFFIQLHFQIASIHTASWKYDILTDKYFHNDALRAFQNTLVKKYRYGKYKMLSESLCMVHLRLPEYRKKLINLDWDVDNIVSMR